MLRDINMFLLTRYKNRYPHMNRVTYHIYGRKDKLNKRGYIPLCLAVSVNSERDLISLSVAVPEKAFDEKTRRVKQSYEKGYIINEILTNAENKVLEILRDANAKDYLLTRRTFRERFSLAFSDDFVAFWTLQIESRNAQLKPATYKLHKSQLTKFKEFRLTVPFQQITPALVEKYESFLIKRGNNVNSRRTALKVLQTYINRAINEDIPIKDPFKKYKIPPEVSTREALSNDELHKLLDAFDTREIPNDRLSSALAFLFSCFTGMRIGDVGKFDRDMLTEGRLVYMPEKTDRQEKVVNLALPDISLRLIGEVISFLDSGSRFKADQKINEDLKKIAAHLSINPRLHFHMARHTFGTTFLRIGGSIEVLQRIMKHSSIRTTQIYVHMIDDRIDREMNFFNSEFK